MFLTDDEMNIVACEAAGEKALLERRVPYPEFKVENPVMIVFNYILAIQGAANTHYEGNMLHCMCNLPSIAYNMQSSIMWRNSDDYFPNRDESHQFHIHTNVMNNLWTSQFSIPDWDMFHSGHTWGSYHAASRAISGGPVYISDKPGEQDFNIIDKLCTSKGEVLRCEQPALPSRDCLFVDCLKEKKL